MDKVQKKEKGSLRKLLKILVTGVVVGVVIPVVNTIIQQQQLKIDQRQAESEQQQLENELAPTMKGEKKGTIMLEQYEYTRYEFYNSENNLAGGKLIEINGIVIVEYEEIRVKTLWIKEAVYKNEIPFDGERQRAAILLKNQDEIEERMENISSKVGECLRGQGVEGDCEFDVRLGIVVTMEYSDSNNDRGKKQYIIYLEEAPYCEAVEEGTVHCDQYYYLEYGKDEKGKEYEAAIEEAAERIRQEYKGN